MNRLSLTSILKCSNELISSGKFCTKHRIGSAFTRSRKLSFLILSTTHFVLFTNLFLLIILNLGIVSPKIFHNLYQNKQSLKQDKEFHIQHLLIFLGLP